MKVVWRYPVTYKRGDKAVNYYCFIMKYTLERVTEFEVLVPREFELS